MNKPSAQVVGNAGLFYVCYELSKRGWNALPTSRNARGVDIVLYDETATVSHTIQVKSLSKRDPVPLGSSLDHLVAEFLVVCRRVFDDKPEVFVVRTSELTDITHRGEKEGRLSYWLEPKGYEPFRDAWDKIGTGYDG